MPCPRSTHLVRRFKLKERRSIYQHQKRTRTRNHTHLLETIAIGLRRAKRRSRFLAAGPKSGLKRYKSSCGLSEVVPHQTVFAISSKHCSAAFSTNCKIGSGKNFSNVLRGPS